MGKARHRISAAPLRPHGGGEPGAASLDAARAAGAALKRVRCFRLDSGTWPIEMFVFNTHVRVGYEVENSRRLGRLLALS